jgi:hypothetical protein
MCSNLNELYEAPTTEVVEVIMDNGILGVSDYNEHDYIEE